MQFLCPHCQKKLTVRDEYAGKPMKCPSCGKTFQAPPANTSAPPAEPAPDPRPKIAAEELTKALHAGDPLGERFSNHIIEGDLDLEARRYSHKLVIQKSVFRGRFNARDARFGCSVDLSDCTFEQGLVLEGARIEGELRLNGATIQQEPETYAANLKQVRVDRDIEAKKSKVEGSLDLRCSKVAGQVLFDGIQISGDLDLQSAEIGMDLSCAVQNGQRTEIGDDAWLSGAKVGRDVHFSGAQIGRNLHLISADIGADLHCAVHEDGQRTEIGWGAWLYAAKVAGLVDFSGAQITGDLDLESVEIGKDLFCEAEEDGQRTEIGRNATFLGARIGTAHLDGRSCPNGILNLSLAEFTKLEIQEALPRQIDTEGLRFQQLSLPNNDYQGFLAASKTFQKSTYRFTENWLRNRGEDREANKVYLAMRRRERREGPSGFARLWGWFLDWSVGYGVRSHRLGIWLLAVLVLTVVLFSSPRSVTHSVVLTTTEAGNTQTAIDPSRFPESWTALDAFWVAVRINVPLVNLGVKNDWAPSSEPIPWLPWITYETYAGFVALTSWITVPLFLAAF
jgi:hypothetical protein